MSAFLDLSPWEGLPTPFLAVDGDTLAENLRQAQAFCDEHQITLRPHAKTHKLAQIAHAQLSAGASGLTVASLGEAEDFAEAGFDDLFVACSVVGTAESARRIHELANKAALRIAADSIEAVEALARHQVQRTANLTLVVEIDSGLRRSGVAPAAAARIARRAADLGFDVAGVFTYPGHGYAQKNQVAAANDERSALLQGAAQLEALGVQCRVRSGGSTPTLFHSSTAATEIRPGVYPLNDAQQVALGSAGLSNVAAVAVATVVSAPDRNRFVLDAGSKTIASDRPSYVTGHGLVLGWPQATIDRIWEHHAVVQLPAGAETKAPRVGDRLAVVPNHICTALNLADRVMALEHGEVQPWELIARGRNA